MKKEVFLRGAAIVTAAVLLVLTGCASVDSYIKKGDLAKAEQAAGKLESPQEKESALILIADEYKKTGNKEKHAQIYTNLGDGYAAANNEDYALKMYHKAANTDKIYPIYKNRADKELTQNNEYKAVDLLGWAGMSAAEAETYVGNYLFDKKEYGRALNHFEKAKNVPKADAVYIIYGDKDLSVKKYDSAMSQYTNGHVETAAAAKKIAEIADKNGDKDFAAVYYEKAGDKAAALATYTAAADTLLSKNEFDKALSFYEKAGKAAEGKTKVAEARRKFDIQKAVNALFGVYSSYRSGYSTEADMIKRRNDIIINADINIIDDIFKTAVDQATETAKDYNTRAMAAFSSGSFDYSSMAVMERNVNEAKYYIAVAQDLIAVKDALIKGLEGAVKK